MIFIHSYFQNYFRFEFFKQIRQDRKLASIDIIIFTFFPCRLFSTIVLSKINYQFWGVESPHQ